MPDEASDHAAVRERRGGERKGDVRARAIVDTCESLLSTRGYDAMTIADIAEGAGITRGALYFYFGSKEAVVAALVARTVEQLWERSAAAAETDDPRTAIGAAMLRTVQLWAEHGPVLRAAIDHSLAVPEIGALWNTTADRFIAAITTVLARAGVATGDGPDQAPAIAHALCWMIERTFYHASQEGTEQHLRDASATCEHIWLLSAGLTG